MDPCPAEMQTQPRQECSGTSVLPLTGPRTPVHLGDTLKVADSAPQICSVTATPSPRGISPLAQIPASVFLEALTVLGSLTRELSPWPVRGC